MVKEKNNEVGPLKCTAAWGRNKTQLECKQRSTNRSAMFGMIASQDEKLRGYMAQQAAAREKAKREAVIADLKSQSKAAPAKAARRVGARYGVSEAGLADLENILRGNPGATSKEVFASGGAKQLIEETARREALQDPLYNLQRMLSGTSNADRVGQVGFYGAAAGGTVAGLTAAGQGLMALMEYIQNGTEQQEARNRELA
jgi:hypothetical protein